MKNRLAQMKHARAHHIRKYKRLKAHGLNARPQGTLDRSLQLPIPSSVDPQCEESFPPGVPSHFSLPRYSYCYTSKERSGITDNVPDKDPFSDKEVVTWSDSEFHQNQSSLLYDACKSGAIGPITQTRDTPIIHSYAPGDLISVRPVTEEPVIIPTSSLGDIVHDM